MAIIALIVTPLVMNIIRRARVASDKRSIDAYGRSIELAIASYLLDTGKFPTSIEQLTIEYSGSEVVCETTQLNSDSSVYLTGCTVSGRSVDYVYGSDKTPPAPTYTAYSIGDHISYNNITYYVIEDSDTSSDTVKLLKETPLNNLDVGYYDENYYHSDYGNSLDYELSDVKVKIDVWKNTAIKVGDIAIARLITYNDLTDNLGFEKKNEGTIYPSSNGNTPSWVYNSNYNYWTMSSYNDSLSDVWYVTRDGKLKNAHVSEVTDDFVIRPVLELNKSADISKLSS